MDKLQDLLERINEYKNKIEQVRKDFDDLQ